MRWYFLLFFLALLIAIYLERFSIGQASTAWCCGFIFGRCWIRSRPGRRLPRLRVLMDFLSSSIKILESRLGNGCYFTNPFLSFIIHFNNRHCTASITNPWQHKRRLSVSFNTGLVKFRRKCLCFVLHTIPCLVCTHMGTSTRSRSYRS